MNKFHITLALSCASVISAFAASKIDAVMIGNRIDVTIDGKFFTSYYFAENEKYPFFFPLNAPVSGGSVTSMRNGEYPHHSSLFFGCDLVNGGNYWQEGLDRGQIISTGARIIESGSDKAVIEDECIWKRPDAESPVKDKRKITISAPHPGLYQLDFDIEMEMLADVTILKTNHSLFSARIDNDLSVKQGGVMINAEGKTGEKETFGKRSTWIDCSGKRATGTEGIAILQHPSNKWYPSPWFTRDYGFISPTPMYWPEDDKATLLKKGEIVKLRYRVLVHSGDSEEANIAGLFDQYSKINLVILAPGHFHAALVQKTSYPQVANAVSVYAPEGNELRQYLQNIEGYNTRPDNPTRWEEKVYTAPDFLEKMKADKTGNVVILAGNNREKTAYIKAALQSGKNVLADKPMAINSQHFETLKECFELSAQKNLLLYDIMTERYEISSILQKEFSQQPGLFGVLQKGTPENPAVVKESVHHFFKQVSGKPLIRPAWFFDVEQQGDGLIDVSTHLIDLIQWACFPEQILDYTKDIQIIDANRYPTLLTPAGFEQVTGETTYPDYLQKDVKNGNLEVYANGDITYTLKGIHAKISVSWNFAAPAGGGDTHYSIMRGTKADLVIRQDKEQNYVPSLYVESKEKGLEQRVADAVKVISKKYEGVKAKKISNHCFEIVIPEKYRAGHEAHFGEVTQKYLQYLSDGKLPAWEVPNMISKYYTTTRALEFALQKGK